jgi:hypothetical protein
MRRLIAAVIVLMCALMLVAAPQPQPPLKELGWMTGLWKSTLGGRISFEQWSSVSASLFIGRGFFLKGTDTMITEQLRLAATDSGVYYIAQPRQNPAPAWFKLVKADSSGWEFENLQRDFPTRIVYRRIGTDSLHARIEGIRKGQPTKIDFVFERAK